MDFFCFWSAYTQRGINAASGCQLPIPRGTRSENPLATLTWGSREHLCSPSCPPLRTPLPHLQPCSRQSSCRGLLSLSVSTLWGLRQTLWQTQLSPFLWTRSLINSSLLVHSHAFISTPAPIPRKTFYLGHPGATPGTDLEALIPGNPQTSDIPQIQRGQRNQGTDHPTNKGEPVINAQNHNHSKPRCPETAQNHKR